MTNNAFKLSALGLTAVAAVAVVLLWRKAEPPATQGRVTIAQPAASAAEKKQAGDMPDYRGIFEQACVGASSPFGDRIDDEKLLADPGYGGDYLAYLISSGQVEWGAFIAHHQLAPQEGEKLLELSARKKLALKNASTAARAFGADATQGSRKALLDEVGREYDGQIKAVLGVQTFESYLQYSQGEARILLEPFFLQLEIAGLGFDERVETTVVEATEKQPASKSGHASAESRLLAFDPAAHEAFSLEQALAFRQYQRLLDALRKNRAATFSLAPARKPFAPGTFQEAFSAFLARHQHELNLDVAMAKSVMAKGDALLGGHLSPVDFSAALVSALGEDGFKKLIAAAETEAVHRQILSVQRKLRTFLVPLTAAQSKQLPSLLAATAGAEKPDAHANDVGDLTPTQRSILAEHMRGSLALEKLKEAARLRLAAY